MQDDFFCMEKLRRRSFRKETIFFNFIGTAADTKISKQIEYVLKHSFFFLRNLVDIS